MNNYQKIPVSSDLYDDKWLKTAWGEDEIKKFIEDKGLNIRPRIKRALELAGLKKGMRILDIACGKGDILLQCARDGVDSFGIDYSNTSVNFARRMAELLPTELQGLIHITREDAKTLSFKDNFFDRIFLLDIVEHLHDWELDRMFAEVKRVLKKDGFAIIHTLPNRWAYDYGYQLARFFIRKLPQNPRSDYEKKGHINEQDIIHLSCLLENNNLCFTIWLENMMGKQANWEFASSSFGDARGSIYPALRKPLTGRLFASANKSPLKLILSNDIYSIVWKNKSATSTLPETGHHLMEKLCILIGKHLRKF